VANYFCYYYHLYNFLVLVGYKVSLILPDITKNYRNVTMFVGVIADLGIFTYNL